jgi:RNA recognition motif-containing protein
MMDQQYMAHPMSQGKVSYNFNSNNQMMMNNEKTDNILFVADLPEETSEEDLENFFKNYNFKGAKLIR